MFVVAVLIARSSTGRRVGQKWVDCRVGVADGGSSNQGQASSHERLLKLVPKP